MDQVADQFNTHNLLFKYFNNLRRFQESLRLAQQNHKAMPKQLSFSGDKNILPEHSSLYFSRVHGSPSSDHSPTFPPPTSQQDAQLLNSQQIQKQRTKHNRQRMQQNAAKMQTLRQERAQQEKRRREQEEEREVQQIKKEVEEKNKQANRQKQGRKRQQDEQKQEAVAEQHHREVVYVKTLNVLVGMVNQSRQERQEEEEQEQRAQECLREHLVPYTPLFMPSKYFHFLWRHLQQKKNKRGDQRVFRQARVLQMAFRGLAAQ